MDQRLTLVTLGVADLVRSEAFYGALGWRRAAESVAGEVAFYQANGLVVALWNRAAMAADARLPDVRSGGFSGVSLALNVTGKATVAAVLAEAAQAGATVTRGAEDTPWGGHNGYFADPDGHLWEVAWNPHWPLGRDGGLRLPSATD